MKQGRILVACALLLICFAGWTLASIKQHQKWTRPGVKVSVGELLSSDGKAVTTITTNIVELPSSIEGFDSRAEALSAAELNGLPPDTTFGRRRYRSSDNFETVLSTVLMGADRTSLHPPRYCIEGLGCSILNTELATIPIEKPVPYELPVSKVLISRHVEHNGQKFMAHGVYVYWYVSESSIHPGYSNGLGTMLKSLLRGQPMERWAFVTCFSECRVGDEERTFEQMKKFIARSIPEFQLLPADQKIKVSSVAVR